MKLATLPRYIDLKQENNNFNIKHYINHDFVLMAHELGVGICTIIFPFWYMCRSSGNKYLFWW